MPAIKKDSLDLQKYPLVYRKYLDKEKKFVLQGLSPSDKILDVGCGIGRLIPEIAPRVTLYIGIDNDQSYVKKANETAMTHPNASVMLLDAHKLQRKFRKNEFDKAIITWNTLGCVKNDKKVLEGLSKVVKNQIIFSVVAKGSLKDRVKYYRMLGIKFGVDKKTETIYSDSWGVVRAYNKEEIKKLCKECGFSISHMMLVDNLGYLVVANKK